MEVIAECFIVWWLAGWPLGTEKTAAFTPGVWLEEGTHRTDSATTVFLIELLFYNYLLERSCLRECKQAHSIYIVFGQLNVC